jgi:hypothetical protein
MRGREFTAKWQARLEEFERLDAQVDGAALVRELLRDVAELRTSEEDELLPRGTGGDHGGGGLMTPNEIIARWRSRQQEWGRVRAQVDGATVCEEILIDLEALAADADEQLVTLTEGAEISGYSREHLGRLVRQGLLQNYGRPNAPKVRRGDLPRRPLPKTRDHSEVSSTRKGRIVRSVVEEGVPR